MRQYIFPHSTFEKTLWIEERHVLVGRDEILFHMISERDKVRLICAPCFYGKTTLAWQYARMCFKEEGVLWINTSHPEFLRDLSRGVVVDALTKTKSTFELVIFDEIDCLREDDEESFVCLLSSLEALNCEIVLITANHTLFSSHKNTWHVVNARDLLLSRNEVSESFSNSATGVECSQRIAGLYRADKTSRERFVDALITRKRTSGLDAMELLSLLLGSGSIGDLQRFLKCSAFENTRILEDFYPHCGVEYYEPSFNALSLEENDFIRLFKHTLPFLVRHSPFENDQMFLEAFVELCHTLGKTQRASWVVHHLFSSEQKQNFYHKNALGLLNEGSIRFVVDLVEDFGKDKITTSKDWIVYLCSCILLNDEIMLRAGLSAMQKGEYSEEAWWFTLLYSASRSASGFRRCGTRLIGHIEGVFSESELTNFFIVHDENSCEQEFYSNYTLLAYHCLHDKDAGIGFLEALLQSKHGSNFLMSFEYLVLYTSIRLFRTTQFSDELMHNDEMFEALLEQELLAGLVSLKPNYSEGFLLCNLQNLGFDSLLLHLPATFKQRGIAMKHRLEREQHAWFSFRRKQLNAGFVDLRTTDSALDSTFQELKRYLSSDQHLIVRMFGGFKMFYHSCAIPRDGRIRTKARSLFALMAINQGKEISRVWLSRVLWPQASETHALQSFYNLWSYLRRLIERETGKKSFIAGESRTVKCSATSVRTDVELLDRVCSFVRDEWVSTENYEELLLLIKDIYQGPLLPGVETFEVVSYRKRYEAKVLETLMCATERLMREENYQLAARFAEYAFLLNHAREDVCYVWMLALRSINQHANALIAYMECRRAMAEEFGIDCSKRLSLLYEEILKEVS